MGECMGEKAWAWGKAHGHGGKEMMEREGSEDGDYSVERESGVKSGGVWSESGEIRESIIPPFSVHSLAISVD